MLDEVLDAYTDLFMKISQEEDRRKQALTALVEQRNYERMRAESPIFARLVDETWPRRYVQVD